MSDLSFLTIAEAAKLLEARQLSPVELTTSLVQRIERENPKLGAFVTLTVEQALAQAHVAEAEIANGDYRGPLHGIPFGLKDIYATAGILTTAHSRILSDNVPQEDAAATTKLYHAGGILMGKLATHEFAHGGPSFDLPWPPARNPWNPNHITGGSSSGCGAAIAAGLVLGALGSDTGGSIRNPAGLCGVAGLKPTFGLVSRYGVIENSTTFDHCGPMAWTAEDCALLLQAIAGFDPRDSGSVDRSIPNYRDALNLDIRGLRVGVIRHFWEEDLPANDEVCAAMEEALETYARLGAIIKDIRLRPLQEFYAIKVIIAESELYSFHRENLRKRPLDFGVDFLGRCLPACLFTADDYINALRHHRRVISEMESIYSECDVLLTAGIYGPAPRFDAHKTINFWRKPSITTPFNVTRGPAIAICCGYSKSGLPLSLQVAGKPFDETGVLRIANAYERAMSWRNRRPASEAKASQPSPHAADVAAEDDPQARAKILDAVCRAGLRLNDSLLACISEAAPYVENMRQRLDELSE